MKNEEIILRELASLCLSKKRVFTQLELSRRLGISLSIINSAIKNLEGISAVEIKQRGFVVISLERLLLYWATHRQLRKDRVYSTRVGAPVREIEASMPGGVAFTAYSGYRKLFQDAVADYSEVYLYATSEALEEIRKRFPERKGQPNLIVMKADRILEKMIKENKLEDSSAPAPQLYADLWNISTWNAKEYLDALGKRLIGD